MFQYAIGAPHGPHHSGTKMTARAIVFIPLAHHKRVVGGFVTLMHHRSSTVIAWSIILSSMRASN